MISLLPAFFAHPKPHAGAKASPAPHLPVNQTAAVNGPAGPLPAPAVPIAPDFSALIAKALTSVFDPGSRSKSVKEKPTPKSTTTVKDGKASDDSAAYAAANLLIDAPPNFPEFSPLPLGGLNHDRPQRGADSLPDAPLISSIPPVTTKTVPTLANRLTDAPPNIPAPSTLPLGGLNHDRPQRGADPLPNAPLISSTQAVTTKTTPTAANPLTDAPPSIPAPSTLPLAGPNYDHPQRGADSLPNATVISSIPPVTTQTAPTLANRLTDAAPNIPAPSTLPLAGPNHDRPQRGADPLPDTPSISPTPPVTAKTASTAAAATSESVATTVIPKSKDTPPPSIPAPKSDLTPAATSPAPPSGMAVAPIGERMKFAADQNKIAGPETQKLPPVAPLSSAAPAKNGDLAPKLRLPVEFSSRDILPQPISLTSVQMTAAPVAASAVVATQTLTPVDRVEQLVAREAVSFQSSGANEIGVTLKIDAHTHLFLQLSYRDGQTQAILRCEKGDLPALTSHFGQLQESLARQNIQLQSSTDGSDLGRHTASGRRQQDAEAAPSGPKPETKTTIARKPKTKTLSRHGFESWA